MKILLNFILLVAVAFLIALLAKHGFGHVIIFVGQYRVDLSLITAIILIVFVFFVFYYARRFWVNVNRLPNKIRKWRQKHALFQSRAYLNVAAINYFEGKYTAAYKNAVRSIEKDVTKDNRFLALIMAFNSAVSMRNSDKEETILKQLDTYQEKKWRLAKLLVIADSQYREEKFGLCIDSLNEILHLEKKHIPAQRLLLKVYLHLNTYEKAYAVLLWLIKHDYLPKSQAESYKLRVLRGLFKHISDVPELQHFYRKLDKVDRENPLINNFYFDALLRLRQYSLAIDLVEAIGINELGFGFMPNILLLAKKLTLQHDLNRLLSICEKALAQHKQNYKLLLTLGIISFNLQLWEKAKSYVEASLALEHSLDGYLYLFIIGKSTNNEQLENYARQMLVENLKSLA